MSGHVLIVGMTEAGKTTLAKRLTASYREAGYKVIVLDPLRTAGWSADYLFRTSDAFFEYVRDTTTCSRCALFVDEAGMALDKYDMNLQWLTTQSRHNGHRAHIISQRAEMVNCTTRSQCGTLAAFQLAPPDCKAYARDFNQTALLQCYSLKQGEYFWAQRFKEPVRMKLF